MKLSQIGDWVSENLPSPLPSLILSALVPQVAAIHTYLGAFTLQVACSSTKFFNHISLLSFPFISFISMSIWSLKTCLRFFLAILFGALALFHVLFGSSSSLLNIIGSSSSLLNFNRFIFFLLAFVRCNSFVRHFKRFIWILMPFNRFNWQEMDFHMSFGLVT